MNTTPKDDRSGRAYDPHSGHSLTFGYSLIEQCLVYRVDGQRSRKVPDDVAAMWPPHQLALHLLQDYLHQVEPREEEELTLP